MTTRVVLLDKRTILYVPAIMACMARGINTHQPPQYQEEAQEGYLQLPGEGTDSVSPATNSPAISPKTKISPRYLH